jgi:hypothetical protein
MASGIAEGRLGMTPETATKKPRGTTFHVQFEYNGDLFQNKANPKQPIESAWRRALAHFGIRPGDVQSQNLGLFHDGNEVDRNQTFEQAGIPENAVLRIMPRVQRAG